MASSPPVSVLILTLNEEANLPRCLSALRWCDDVVVLDCYSSDRTREIAEAGGARFIQRAFDDFAGQRNFALEQIRFRHPWVFHLDADEVFTPELLTEMTAAIAAAPGVAAFRVPSRTMFMGRWLKHAGMYPTYQVRLTRTGAFRFQQVGHGQKECATPGESCILRQPYWHFAFSHGLDEWFDKHNRYAHQEAVESLRQTPGTNIAWTGLLSRDPYRRRQVFRQLAARLPARPLLRFVYMYLLRFGFLDGEAGWQYCRLLAVYEFMIVAKRRELLLRERGVVL